MAKKYHTVIIGAGPAGYVAAIRCAQLGMQVAVVDAWVDHTGARLGGTCLNAGCIPSKALLESSYHYARLTELAEHGIQAGKTTLDLPAMMQRKDGIVKKLNQGIAGLFKHHCIEWLQGYGQLLDAHTVSVKNDNNSFIINTKNVILATGSRPVELPGIAFDGTQIIDSSDALSLPGVPSTLGIIGAGVIGLELGAVWQRLGSKITIFEATDTFLPMLDNKLARQARTGLLPKERCTLHLNTRISAAEKQKNRVKVTYEDDKGDSQQATFDHLLVAVGRCPNTEALFANDCPLQPLPSGEIDVNEYCQTHLPNVYAIGDIVRGPKLAHKGSKEGIMAAERIAGQHSRIDYDCIPSVIYTHPEIATVGLNEAQLQNKGIAYRVGQSGFAANGRALAANETTGSIKLFTAQDSHTILGAQIVGPQASELIQEIVTVMSFSGTSEDIADIMHGHPTLSETLCEAAEDSLGLAIHSITHK